ncbi:hypothetical protein [Winogradskya humida]|uniref:Uncharacterized protein n=1 Tax=Winogradskya humida TaxID=113566 RepID=A0ABQ3ZMF5_9ACTN|nr:hypothetical protein [Actinoplanes humidus]GIE19751.1 hypothetical protein Ahu01nite_028530 [Actinoplanes humidus]
MATKSSVQQRRRSRRRAALVLVPTVAGVFVAGTAFAYWSTSGSGTGTSSTGTSTAVTVTQLTPYPAAMVPGGADQAINFTVTNTLTTNQYVAGVLIGIGPITVGGSPAVGCTASDFAITQPNAINADLTGGPHDYNPSGAKIHMVNALTNQDGCKNATVNLTFTAS